MAAGVGLGELEFRRGVLLRKDKERLMESITKAAAFCYRFREGKPEVLLVRTSNKRHQIFPKGTREKGEELWQTALREAGEEAGVSGTVEKEPFDSFGYKKKGCVFKVAVFMLSVECQFPCPEPFRQPSWFSLSEAARILGLDSRPGQGTELCRILNRGEALLRQRG